MKKSYSIMCILMFHLTLQAQIVFDTHVIDAEEKEAYSLDIADADGDGDLDVFYCSWTGGIAGWYENLDGSGDYGPVHIIDQGDYLIKNIDVSDINGDGMVDVILSISDLDEIRCYTNDGEGNFSQKAPISSNSVSPSAAKGYDLDGDGDLDILTASYGDHTIAWHENIDGEGLFGTRKRLAAAARGASDAIAVDIDNDGDLDVFYTSLLDNTTAWVENLGNNGSFGPEQILTAFTINPTKIQAKDLDLDGDLDIFVTAQSANTIVTWENLDGNGSFSERIYIDVEMSNASVVVNADIDSDGDGDFILANWNFPNIEWQENYDGKSTLGRSQKIGSGFTSVQSILAADIDGDGDEDLVVASNEEGKIVWYENKNIISNVLSGLIKIELELEDCNDESSPLPFIRIDSKSSTDTVSAYSLSTGYYQLYPGIGTYYTSPLLNLPDYFSAFPEDFETTHNDIGNIDYLDFCVIPIEDATDVSVVLIPPDAARPGFVTTYDIYIENRGSIIESGEVMIEYDGTKFDFLSSSLPVVSASANTVVLRYSDLTQLSSKSEKILFQIPPPPTANIGDIVEFNVSITPIEEDRIPEDNSYTLIDELRGSYDPNDIRVLEGDKIFIEQKDDFLHYIIRFQNTGTASAIHVRVENLLDNKLDWSTFTPLSMSHKGKISVKNNKNVTFDFQYINLPDSLSDEPASHGTITYKIKPLEGFNIGDSISNTADIYFDFNPPITTNTVVTKLTEPTNITDMDLFDPVLFPNPVNDVMQVEMETIPHRIIVQDVYGTIVHEVRKSNRLDLKTLNSGYYSVHIFKTEDISVIRKIIVNH